MKKAIVEFTAENAKLTRPLGHIFATVSAQLQLLPPLCHIDLQFPLAATALFHAAITRFQTLWKALSQGWTPLWGGTLDLLLTSSRCRLEILLNTLLAMLYPGQYAIFMIVQLAFWRSK